MSASTSRVNGSTRQGRRDRRRADVVGRLAVNNVVKEKNGVYLNSGSGTSDLQRAQCSPNTIHWAYDTYQLANGTGSAMVKNGGDTWFFLTADYAFGIRWSATPRTP
jgi:ABC-type branched-subunit amino acid transport system substrate-binding protein